MASFLTTEPNREWRVRLTVGLCEELKRNEGFDIGGIVQDAEKLVAVLTSDPAKVVRILWECCKGQAAAFGVTPEDFGKLFDEEALEAGLGALLDSAVGFTPKAAGREGIRKGLAKFMEKMATAADMEIERKVDQALSTSFASAGSTPGSSESTPAT